MTTPADGARAPIEDLLAIMARLRDPDGGCAWDLEQTFATIAPYTVEEAYEVADAIQRGSMSDLAEELGDLLFQVVFHARMAQEAGAFDFDDVARGIATKMLRRHPHVFGEAQARTAKGGSTSSCLSASPERVLSWACSSSSRFCHTAQSLVGISSVGSGPPEPGKRRACSASVSIALARPESLR